MGFFDVLRGKRELKKPAPTDRLFAMTTAQVTLELELGLKSRGRAAIVFQPLATADFEGIVRDMEEVVRSAGSDTGTAIEVEDDQFGYRWMVLVDPDFEDLVVGINAVSTALEAGGYGDRILCAVFGFEGEDGRPIYWIYNYKRGAFYPFVPGGGEQQRDNERELRLKAQIGAELPVEADLERWFPLWGIPI
jgi:hypothetical protein